MMQQANIITMIADVLAPIWRQTISNHRAEYECHLDHITHHTRADSSFTPQPMRDVGTK